MHSSIRNHVYCGLCMAGLTAILGGCTSPSRRAEPAAEKLWKLPPVETPAPFSGREIPLAIKDEIFNSDKVQLAGGNLPAHTTQKSSQAASPIPVWVGEKRDTVETARGQQRTDVVKIAPSIQLQAPEEIESMSEGY